MFVLTVAGLAPVVELADAAQAIAGTHAADIAASEDCGEECGGDCEESCKKSGCHAGVHHCGCCAPAPRMTSESPLVLAFWHDTPEWRTDRSRAPPSEGEAPPRQPPRG